jgi:hypothetical protein
MLGEGIGVNLIFFIFSIQHHFENSVKNCVEC